MDLDTLAKLGEFVGGSFVVISLIYLAHQVRQNTKSLQTENYARVLERMSILQARLSACAPGGGAKPAPLSSDFEAFVEQLMHTRHVDGAVLEPWQLFVAGDELTASGARARMKRTGALMLVLVAACEAPREQPRAAAAGDTAAALANTAGPKACALLSAGEIAAVTGLTLKDGVVTHDYGGSSQCRFDRPDGAQAIMFTVHTQADIANYRSVPGSEAVSGVGDAAVWNEGTSQLAVRVGEGVFSISFFTPPARRQWAVRLAEPIVAKLK